MRRLIHAVVAAVACLLASAVLAQSPSDVVVRNFLLEEIGPHIAGKVTDRARDTGLDQAGSRASAERASAAVVDCLIKELELLALTNNVERTLFMESLAFAIAWDSDREFIRQFKGFEGLSANARACIEHGLVAEGVEFDD